MRERATRSLLVVAACTCALLSPGPAALADILPAPPPQPAAPETCARYARQTAAICGEIDRAYGQAMTTLRASWTGEGVPTDARYDDHFAPLFEQAAATRVDASRCWQESRSAVGECRARVFAAGNAEVPEDGNRLVGRLLPEDEPSAESTEETAAAGGGEASATAEEGGGENDDEDTPAGDPEPIPEVGFAPERPSLPHASTDVGVGVAVEGDGSVDVHVDVRVDPGPTPLPFDPNVLGEKQPAVPEPEEQAEPLVGPRVLAAARARILAGEPAHVLDYYPSLRPATRESRRFDLLAALTEAKSFERSTAAARFGLELEVEAENSGEDRAEYESAAFGPAASLLAGMARTAIAAQHDNLAVGLEQLEHDLTRFDLQVDQRYADTLERLEALVLERAAAIRRQLAIHTLNHGAHYFHEQPGLNRVLNVASMARKRADASPEASRKRLETEQAALARYEAEARKRHESLQREAEREKPALDALRDYAQALERAAGAPAGALQR